jgi:hypothetical protein
VHQARIKITLDLPPGKSDTVKISLINGGAGGDHNLVAWRWTPPPVKAALLMDAAPGAKPQSTAYGDAAPLTMTTTGTLLGTLTSSNSPESTTIKVEIPAQGIVATSKVIFVEPTLKIDSDGLSLQVGKASSAKVSVLFDGTPVDGHLMKISMTKIEFSAGSALKREVGPTEFDSTDMTSCVDVGGDGRTSFYLTQPNEKEHTVFLTQTNPFNGTIEYEADDLSSAAPTLTAATAQDPVSRQWLRWSNFLDAWQSLNTAPCAAAFAGNNRYPGKLTLAQALQTRGDRPGWIPRLRFPTVTIRHDFPMVLSVTTFWTIPNSDPKRARKFHATEELFDIKLLHLTPYVVGYDVKNTTQPEFTAGSDFIQKMTTRADDPSLSDAQRIASGVSAAIACAQLADTDHFWDTLQTLQTDGLANYPEQLMQIQGILTGLTKDDPIPEKFKQVAAALLPK